MKNYLLRFALTLFLAMSLGQVWGQAVGDYRTNATGTWNWNNAANWQRCVTAGTWFGATSTTYPGQNSGAGTVNILDNTIVNITVNVPNSIGALSINGGGNDSYVQFSSGVSLTVSGQTYLNSTSNNDYKSILVDAGVFRTGSISANSDGDSRDAYISISTGSVTVDNNISLNSTNVRTYILFTGSGTLYVGGTISGGNITSTTDGGSAAPTSGTVNYNASGAQTIGTYTYYNLALSGSGDKSIASPATVGNNLEINGTAKANMATGFNMTAYGLKFAGVDQVKGTWGSSSSVATNKNDTYFSSSTGYVTISSRTFYSRADGNWNDNNTWSLTTPGGAAVAAGIYPVAGDIVYIERGNDVTITADAACASIDFTTTTATLLSINSGITLNVSGAITIPRPGSNMNLLAVGAGNLNAGSIAFTNAGTNVRHQVTISTGTVTVTGNITGSTGNTSCTISFSGAGTLNLGGSIFTNTAGTLTTYTGSTVNYNASGAQTVGNFTYSNLTLSGSGAKTTTGATVSGILSMEGTATTAGTVATYNASATLQYKGSSSQTTGIEFPTTFSGTGGVIINNSNGVSLGGNRNIANGLRLTSGILSLGNYNLTLSSTGSAISGTPSSSAMIVTNGTGQLIKAFPSGVSSFTFPVGDITGTVEYSPLTISFATNTSSTGTVGVIVNNSDHASINTPVTAAGNLHRYWTLSSTGLPANYSYQMIMGYNAADVNGVDTDLKLQRWNSGTSTWTSDATSVSASNTLTSTAGITQASFPLTGDYTGRHTGPIYYSRGTDPNVLTNWNTVRTGGGSTPSSFTANYQTFVIQNGYTMTTSANWTISGSSSKLEIESGGRLVANSHTVSVSGTSSSVLVDNGGTLSFIGTSTLTGNNNFTLYSGGNLEISDANGITSSGATGNIQNTGTTRAFDASANYTYRGTSNQLTGSGLPSSVNNLIINNTGTPPANVVTISGDVIVNGTLTLTAGIFAVDGHTLRLNGPTIAGTPTNLSTTSASGLIFGGGSTGVNIPSSVTTLSNLNINNSNGVTLNSNITLSGDPALTLSSGILHADSHTIRIANTSTTAVSAASPSNYISGGSLSRVLNSGGTNIYFPVGNSSCGGYHQLTLNNPAITDGSEIRITYACTGVGSADATLDSPLPFTYNWGMELVSGSLTSTDIRVESADIDLSHNLGYSATQGGTYTLLGNCTPGTGYITATGVSALPKFFTPGVPKITTYYSYKTGNWNDYHTWTLDPSGTTQVGTGKPGTSSIVNILSGRTVTLTADTASSGIDLTIEEGAFLDLGPYQFTSGFNSLSGQGTLRIGSDVFPTPIAINNFVLAGGGTTEYTTAMTLPSQAVYNNLTINANSKTVIQTIDLNLNGSLNVQAGTFQINDNTARRLKLIVNGDVTVKDSLIVGTGVTNSTTNPLGITGTTSPAPFIDYYDLQSHRIVLNGNFTNNGTVRFTNLSRPLYNSFPPTGGSTAGFATVYFRGATDNTLLCAGKTDFYNLVVDKGSDLTFKLKLYTSGSYQNFRLFGANISDGDGGTGNPNLKKALWIRTGTLVLEGTTVIPSLTEGSISSGSPNSDFVIPSNGALVVNGIDVIVQTTADDYREVNMAYGLNASSNADFGISAALTGSSLTLYGKLQMDEGYLTTKESAGIITNSTASGQLVINKGTLDAKQFLSQSGAASFEQNGGLFLLRGRFQRTPSFPLSSVTDLKAPLNTIRANDAGLTSTAGTFNLNNVNNVFLMSGGTLRIYDACTTGSAYAFQVNSSTSNINVTGGTIEFIPTTGTGGSADADYHLISTTASLGNVIINRASSSSIVQLNTNPLTVLGNLTLTAGAFESNNLNVTIGGNFSLASGTSYAPGTNTTTLNGSGAQTITVNLASALTLYNLTLDKTSGVAVTFAGSQSNINVSNNFRLVLGTLNDNGNTINIAGTVYNSGLHSGTGKLVLSGSAAQTIDGNGIFGNLELFNTTSSVSAPVSLLANLSINGTLTFSNDKLFDIGTYNLKMNGSAAFANAGTDRYIKSAGNAGDGGITKVYSNYSAFVFPIGVNNYTPASIGLSQAPTAYGSITVIPVNYAHPNVTTSGRSLSYFWRVKSSGFTLGSARVTHGYTYADANIVTGTGITENEYVAARYNPGSYSWTRGVAADVDESNNIIGEPGAGSFLESVSFIDGDYTAGDDNTVNPFGTPVVFYSRQNGPWSNTSTWSLTSHTQNNPPSSAPGVNDIVVIGNGNRVTLSGTANCASLQIASGAVLDIYDYTGSNFRMVLNHSSGSNGLFRLKTTDASLFNRVRLFTFPSGDFSDFNVNKGTTEFYTTTDDGSNIYILPASVNSYGNLILSPNGWDNLSLPNNSSTTIYGDLTLNSSDYNSWITMSWNTTRWGNNLYNPTIEKTVYVKGNLYVNGGTFKFMDDYAAQHLVVDGNVVVANSTNARIDVEEGSGSVYCGGGFMDNTFAIGGSLINNSIVRLDYTRYCDLTFFGANSSFITNTAGTPSTTFRRVTVNKGISQTSTLTCNIGGALATPADNWLTLQNGTFIYDRSANLTLTTTSSFTIPPTAGLQITNANTVYLANSSSNTNDVYLNGKLTILAGNVYIGSTTAPSNNNDIEYSGSGASEIDIQGGSLTVNGQIRRNPSVTSGVLKYSQSGGTVSINGNAANTTNAKLEVVNDGSSFNMSSGTLNIVRGGGGSTNGDLYLRPGSGSVTGGNIVFAHNIGGTNQSYLLDATIPLNNLTITGRTAATAASATVKLMVNPLTLNGNLTLTNAQSILDVDTTDINLTINGNFINNGTYNHYNNLTTFNGNIQILSGTSATDFYDLTVSPTTSLTLSSGITVLNNIRLSEGTLICGTNLVQVNSNVINNATYTNTGSTGGLILNGPNKQYISGTGTFGQLELDNTRGSTLENDITLNKDLILTYGIFDIDEYLLTLGMNSNIIAKGTTFSVDKMITSDGVWSNVGIKKVFPISTTTSTFTYPIGVAGKYTRAVLTIYSNAAVGSIRINNINSHHPAVIGPNGVLQYYWELESAGISGFNGNLVYYYNQADVKGTESTYVAAQLLTPGTVWRKSTDDVDEANNTITFNYTNKSDITGECTAGMVDSIPEVVPQYVSIKNGNWSDKDIWESTGGSTYPCPDGGPNGFIVTIDHVVTLNNSYCSSYKTYINNELRVENPYYGHNLGSVYGNGTLYLESAIFPAGRFNSFLDCAGNGTLEYGGTGTYNVTADLYNSVPNLVFSGAGSRILPDKDLTICKRLEINGPVLDNSVNNRELFIQGAMLLTSGSFESGSGDNATVSFIGSTPQTIEGFTGSSSFNNLEINNNTGLTLAGEINVAGKLLLTEGLINTTYANILKLDTFSVNCVVPIQGRSNSYVNGPLMKKLNQGDPSFIFPIGKASYGLGDKFALRATQTGTQYWTAELINPNEKTTYASPLSAVNTKEYWKVSGMTTGSAAYVEIGWQSSSDLTPLMTQYGLSDMRVAGHNGTDWTEIASTFTSGSGNSTGSVETISKAGLSSDTCIYTLACINTVKPRIRLTPTGPVCGTSGIPVTLTTSQSISGPYVISYTENGTNRYLYPLSFPTTIPTLATGATYVLTGFTYNGVSGVVDATPVIAYPVPTTAAAGADTSICGASIIILAGNNPVVGTGQWSIINGTGGTVTTPDIFNSGFTGTNGSAYTLRWTISSGTCLSTDDVIIRFPLLAAQPGSFIVATPVACQLTNGITYTVPNDPTSTYEWTYSGTGVTGYSGITTNSVILNFSSNATGGTLSVTAENSCNISPARDYTIIVHPKGEWTGTVSSDWFNPANWSCPGVPTSVSDVTIPSIAPFMPVIGASGAVCNNVIINEFASLTISGSNNLNVNGNWTNNSLTGLIASNASTVSFVGTSSISGTQTTSFGGVTISGTLTAPSGNMNVAGSLTNTGTFIHNSGTVTFNGTSAQVISSTPVIVFNNLTVQGSDVSLDANSKVTVAGSTSITGSLTLRSSSTDDASFIPSESYTQTGSVIVERFVSGNRWHYFFPNLSAIPTVNFTAEGGSTNPNLYSMYEPNEDYWNATTNFGSTGWTYEYAKPNIRTDKGFIFNRYNMADKIFLQTGGTLFTSPTNFTVSYTHHSSTIGNGCTPGWDNYDGWNLVGNPYTCAVDWEAVNRNYTAGSSGIEATIYYFDGATQNYVYYIQGEMSSGIGANGGSRYVPSGQGFMVKAANNTTFGNTTFNIPIFARTHHTQTFLKSSKVASNILRFNINQNGYTDETVIRTLPSETDVSDNHDGNFDAFKMFAWDKSKPQIYTANTGFTSLFAINSFADVETGRIVPVGIYCGTSGQHTINFTENAFENIHIYLEDKILSPGTLINVKANPIYTFSHAVGTDNSRFVLHFNENHAPVANGNINNQVINEDETFSYTSSVSFSDEDLGDVVSVSAEYPAWLSFDPATKTFYGTPSNNDVGSYTIKLIGYDLLSARAEVTFNLEVVNVNDPPELINSLQDQIVYEDVMVNIPVPAGTIIDPDLGDALSYSATLSDGQALPVWLRINPFNGELGGTPSNSDIGQIEITITATDHSDESASGDFTLTVLNVNDAPALNGNIPDQEIALNSYYSYTIDQNLFYDVDLGDELTLSAKLADNSELPSWLSFDGTKRELFGTAGLSGNLGIVITATDKSGAKTSDEFILSVKNSTGIDELDENEVLIFPNPTKGLFYINIGKLTENLKVNIWDYNGKLVLEKRIVEKLTEFDLKGLADGVYSVELKDDKQSMVYKIILQK